MNRLTVVAVISLLTLMTGSVSAQVVYGQPASVAVRAQFASWNIDSADSTESISQVHFPVGAFVPVADNTELLIHFYGAKSNFEQADASSIDLSGVGDAQLQLNQSLADDQLILGLGVNLPLGKKKLTFDKEAHVLIALARDYLRLPSRGLGEGLGLNLLVGGAKMMGSYRCGAGIRYQYNGKYDPYDDTPDFNPGDALSVTVGADRQTDGNEYYVDFSWTLYTKDKLKGDEVFRQSTQIALGAGYAINWESSRLYIDAGYLIRGRNSTYSPSDSTTVESKKKLNGNELRASLRYVMQMKEVWSITPTGEFRTIAANDNGLDKSSIFGLGVSIGRKLSESMSLTTVGKYYTGKADGGELTLTGMQFSLGLTANL